MSEQSRQAEQDTLREKTKNTTGSAKPVAWRLDGSPFVGKILSSLTGQRDNAAALSDHSANPAEEDDDRAVTSPYQRPTKHLDHTVRVDVSAQLDTHDLIRQLNAKRAQLNALIDEIRPDITNWAIEFDPNKYIGRYPALSPELLQVVLANSDVVLNNEALREALCIGGERVRDRHGSEVMIYTLDSLGDSAVIGWGGIGKVKDGYVLKGKKLTRAAIKEPILAEANATKEALADQAGRIVGYHREAYNASNYLQSDIPGVVRCLTVTESRANGLPLIAYEKIVNKEGVVQNGYDFARDINIPPSQKLAALAGVIDTVARLHAHPDGLAHCDIKPENLFMGPDDKLKLGDPGSVTSIRESLSYTLSAQHPNKGELIRNFVDTTGQVATEVVALTPHFASVQDIAQACELGHDIRIADRRALAVTIVDFLQLAHVLSGQTAKWQDPEIYQTSDVKTALPPTERSKFLTYTLQQVIVLVQELANMQVSVHNLRPLTAIANDLRKCAQQCKGAEELDSLYQIYRNSLQPTS